MRSPKPARRRFSGRLAPHNLARKGAKKEKKTYGTLNRQERRDRREISRYGKLQICPLGGLCTLGGLIRFVCELCSFASLRAKKCSATTGNRPIPGVRKRLGT